MQCRFAEYDGFRKQRKITRREAFLAEMDRVVPWARLEALIEPHYPVAGNGRKPYPLSTILRIHFLQHWYGYSDPGMEEALHDIPVLRRFARLDAGTSRMPDETTILNFRHLLEAHRLAESLFQEVVSLLTERGLILREGTIVDATLIAAPPSTKNEGRKRDPEMTSSKKGNQWHFGMKAHIGVDSKEGIVHSVCSTAASVSDVHMLPDLLHGGEKKVWGDAGYQGQIEAIREAAPAAQDMTSRRVKTKAGVDQAEKRKNRTKARVRAKVEWTFGVLKRVFGFTKVRYRGLKKNHEWLCASFALVNLYRKRKRLARIDQRLASPGA